MVYHWIDTIQSRLFPPRCRLCGAPGEEGRALCAGCHAELPHNRHGCARCGQPLPPAAPAGTPCGDCQRRPPPFDASVIPLLYRPPVDRLVTGLKFHRRLADGALLSALLHEALRRRAVLPERLIPVPLHPARLRQRGYNQALELARPLARRLGIPLDYRSCVRRRATPPQAALNQRERLANLRGAFALRHPPGLTHVAIIDDVVTTGATAAEVARALKRAGVDRVELWAAARTP